MAQAKIEELYPEACFYKQLCILASSSKRTNKFFIPEPFKNQNMNIHGVSTAFNNLNRINILLGKNGVGKSTTLKDLANPDRQDVQNTHIEYVTPERGGFLMQDVNEEVNASQNPNHIRDTRRQNQASQFKQQSMFRYQSLEIQVLRAVEQASLERDKKGDKGNIASIEYFETYIAKINGLLENIYIQRSNTGKGFKIRKKINNAEINTNSISSGESELIALAIECLFFQKDNNDGKPKILLLDEPDVHLHPDLQVKFFRYLHDLATEPGKEFTVILATHSTVFLGAIEDHSNINICFTTAENKIFNFRPVSDVYKSFLPVFGAHPLSNLFNQSPVLLVEGEDDERIWQQAVRSSNGRIKVYPCVCGSVNDIHRFEEEIKEVIKSIYDKAKAYSIRDRDDSPNEDIPDEPPIIRHRLRCYSAENLLLADEVLAKLGKDWSTVIALIEEWIEEKKDKNHPQLKAMSDFQASGYDRRNLKVKDLRVLLVGIMGSTKPWEIIVGQTLASIRWNEQINYELEGSIYSFLGKKLVENLLIKE